MLGHATNHTEIKIPTTTASTSTTSGALVVAGGAGIGGDGFFGGDVVASVAGKGLKIKEGANARMGTATLNGTTAVTIPTTVVTANSRIFLTVQAPGGTVGMSYVSARSAGVSFDIKSTDADDTSTVAWLIVEPAP